jgi:class 3 adenylate cyclase
MVAVVKNRCGQEMSIKVKGSSSVYVGNKDYHNTLFDGKEMQESYEARRNIWQSRLRGKELPPPEYLDLLNTIYEPPSREDALASLPGGFCSNRLSVYPTKEFRDAYLTNRPLIYTSMVVVMFVFAIAVFIAYNYVVERRQTLVNEEAKRSRAIVNSFFPAIVSDKLFGPRKIEQSVRTCRRSSIQQWCEEETGSHKFRLNLSPKIRLTALLKDRSSNSEDHPNQDDGDDPIAEMFLESEYIKNAAIQYDVELVLTHASPATILFADIAGFTAWSSEREPRQVFKLLETLYRSFDEAAKELGVFKVETIGDCYVAVTGLPDPSADHALVMCKFAVEIRRRMEVLTQELVSSLGPGTAELGLRIGLHSGPVTAGVLRSDKARFQLFGDAMNTASRMESTGDKNRIQVSQETADLIIEFGKAKWLTPREDEVDVKGKGTMRVGPGT